MVDRRKKILYCAIQCLYWIGGCSVVSFAAVFLRANGFHDSEVGVTCAAGSALGFFIMTSVSSALDLRRMTMRRALSLLYSAELLCLLPIIAHIPLRALTAMFYAVCIGVSLTLNSVYNKLYTNLSRGGVQLNFGLARGLGSFSFSAASAALGILVSRLGVALLPFAAAALLLLQAAGAFLLLRGGKTSSSEEDNSQPEKQGLHLGSFVLRNKRFFVLVLGCGIVLSVNSAFNTFLVLIAEQCGGTAKTLGYLNSYMALLEIPMMLCFSQIRRRVSLPTLMRTGIVSYVLMAAGFTFAKSIPVLFASATLRAFSFGLFTPASVEYVSEKIAFEDTAKGQSLFVAVPALSSSIIVLTSGFVLERAQGANGFLAFLAFDIVGALICFASIDRK